MLENLRLSGVPQFLSSVIADAYNAFAAVAGPIVVWWQSENSGARTWTIHGSTACLMRGIPAIWLSGSGPSTWSHRSSFRWTENMM